MMRVGFIGAGLQAKRRIPAIHSFSDSRVVAITSRSMTSAKTLGKQYDIPVVSSWQEIISDTSIDAVVIATYPDTHAEICIEALKQGKHVLCEKPLAKTVAEAKTMVTTAKKYKRILKCGFNHRHHPAVFDAKKLIEQGAIGKLLFGRGIYGHCGRPGFEKEWRTNPAYTAGGILMEQGIHLVDIFSWFFGEMSRVHSFMGTLYFPIKPFEDTAFVTLQTKHNQLISINSTNLQWKNLFRCEVYGEEGYLSIDGLGQSYGTETLTIGKKAYQGPFAQEVREYRGEDISWKEEWKEFTAAIEHNREPIGNGMDGVSAMKIIEAVYTSAKNNGQPTVL